MNSISKIREIPKPRTLLRAAESGSASAVQRLLDLGADPNGGRRYDDGATPLGLALEPWPLNVEMAMALLEAGAKPNEPAFGHTPPLFLLFKKGQINAEEGANASRTRLLGELLRRGANPEAVSGGYRIIHLVCAYGTSEDLQILMHHCPDLVIDAAASNNETALAIAVNNFNEGHALPLVKTLLEAGHPVTNTAFYRAILKTREENFSLVEAFLDSGASLDAAWTEHPARPQPLFRTFLSPKAQSTLTASLIEKSLSTLPISVKNGKLRHRF